jgi:hypothetical protein
MYVRVFELILTNAIARMIKMEKISDLVMIKASGHFMVKKREIKKVADKSAEKCAFLQSHSLI